MPAIEIRLWKRDDFSALAALHEQAGTIGAWRDSGVGWTARYQNKPIGYAAYEKAPGLPKLAALRGLVAEAWRRQGIGGTLLEEAATGAAAAGIRQLSVSVHSLSDPTAIFFRNRGFAIAHEEQSFVIDAKRLPPLPAIPNGAKFIWGGDQIAAQQFQSLYDIIFSPHPWHQPYSIAEINAQMPENPILFLAHGGKRIGFAWGQKISTDKGRIEPLGISPAFQGRGWGTLTLIAACRHLAQRGVRQIEMGTWRANSAAIRLYQKIGFKPVATIIYLARSL